MNWWQYLLSPVVLIFLVPVVALVGGTVTSLVKKHYRHRERMAMIAQGIHPDYPPADYAEDGAYDADSGEASQSVPKETTDLRASG